MLRRRWSQDGRMKSGPGRGKGLGLLAEDGRRKSGYMGCLNLWLSRKEAMLNKNWDSGTREKIQ